MTRVEAEAQAAELNKTEPKWYCPLIKEDCNKRCVNFTGAYTVSEKENSNQMIHDIKDDSFTVQGFFCSNASFVGDFVCGMD